MSYFSSEKKNQGAVKIVSHVPKSLSYQTIFKKDKFILHIYISIFTLKWSKFLCLSIFLKIWTSIFPMKNSSLMHCDDASLISAKFNHRLSSYCRNTFFSPNNIDAFTIFEPCILLVFCKAVQAVGYKPFKHLYKTYTFVWLLHI